MWPKNLHCNCKSDPISTLSAYLLGDYGEPSNFSRPSFSRLSSGVARGVGVVGSRWPIHEAVPLDRLAGLQVRMITRAKSVVSSQS